MLLKKKNCGGTWRKTSDLQEASCLFPQSTVIWPPFQPYQVLSPPNSHLSGRGQDPIVKLQRDWSISSATLRQICSKGHQDDISNPFPFLLLFLFQPLPTGRVIRRRTLHIESHLPPWRGHLGPENNECLTKTNKHKIAGGRRKGPLSDCFFPFILAGQGSSEAGLICLALGMHRVCSVPWRVLNNHRISKYLHSITVLGKNLLGWVTLGTLSPLSSEELLTSEAVSFPPLGGWWVLLQPGHSSAFKWHSWDPTMKCLPTLTAETQRAWLLN